MVSQLFFEDSVQNLQNKLEIPIIKKKICTIDLVSPSANRYQVQKKLKELHQSYL